MAGEVLKETARTMAGSVSPTLIPIQLTDNEVINIVSNANYAYYRSILGSFTASFTDLVNVPAGLADGDDDTRRAAGDGLCSMVTP